MTNKKEPQSVEQTMKELQDIASFKDFYKPRDYYQEAVDVCAKFDECMSKIIHEFDEIRKIFKEEASKYDRGRN